MKCIVIETSHERANAHPVTNENGTPHVYATISEARAELKANGYSYNRANDRYYIMGTEYRAYIIREDSEEYAEIMEAEAIQTVSGNTIYKTANDSGEIVFTVRGRIFWTLAEARYYAQCNPTADAQRAEIVAELISDPAACETYLAHAAAHEWSAEETHANIEHANQIKDANRAALALLDAYADAIGEHPTEDDPETRAAYRVARDEITGTSARATDHDRAIVADMVEDIAARATFEARRSSAEDIRAKFDSPWLEWKEDDTENAEQAKPYQRAELEAFLGEYVSDYDVDAIEAEATEAGHWTPEAVRDLMSICERHEIKA